MWLYDAFLIYFGSYSYILSHISGPRSVFDEQLNQMTTKMLKSSRKVQAEKVLNETSLEDWKCYWYYYDMMVGGDIRNWLLSKKQ